MWPSRGIPAMLWELTAWVTLSLPCHTTFLDWIVCCHQQHSTVSNDWLSSSTSIGGRHAIGCWLPVRWPMPSLDLGLMFESG
jgi:hypothetical protein